MPFLSIIFNVLVEQALNSTPVALQLPREKVQVGTKCGIAGFNASGMLVKGTPDYMRACCEASLQRLAVDYIDQDYQHRIDQSVPIEETVCICWSFTVLFSLKYMHSA
jgi:aryl-alcohol dehydrogenase-like predicted oxidoreductase